MIFVIFFEKIKSFCFLVGVSGYFYRKKIISSVLSFKIIQRNNFLKRIKILIYRIEPNDCCF
jgi:hypothetical protein